MYSCFNDFVPYTNAIICIKIRYFTWNILECYLLSVIRSIHNEIRFSLSFSHLFPQGRNSNAQVKVTKRIQMIVQNSIVAFQPNRDDYRRTISPADPEQFIPAKQRIVYIHVIQIGLNVQVSVKIWSMAVMVRMVFHIPYSLYYIRIWYIFGYLKKMLKYKKCAFRLWKWPTIEW